MILGWLESHVHDTGLVRVSCTFYCERSYEGNFILEHFSVDVDLSFLAYLVAK